MVALFSVFLVDPLECLLGGITGWRPQSVPNPSPSSASDLIFSWQLVGMLPQVCVADDVWSVYLEDSSNAAIDESLYFPDCGLCCSPCLRPIQKDRLDVGS